MKYITIPKNSEHTIDLAAITNDYKGIIIVYKEGMAVGRFHIAQIPSCGIFMTIQIMLNLIHVKIHYQKQSMN